MKSNFSQRVARLARSLWWQPTLRAVAPPHFRPTLLCLEDRAVPSTLTVTNLADSGDGSLRFELAQAQNGDTIVFDNALQGTITLTSGELQISQSVTIQGPGAANLSISGNNASRVFEVMGGADVTLEGLTITGGLASASASGSVTGSGGGIYIDHGAALRLLDSVVTGNTANEVPTSAAGRSFSGSGGGIYVDSGASLTLTGSAVTGNTANTVLVQGLPFVENFTGTGGGIYNAGTLTASDSTISGNIANEGTAQLPGGFPADSDFGYGGGVYNLGTMTLTDSTVKGNTASAGSSSSSSLGEGGGLQSFGTLSLSHVTVSGNIANSATVTDLLNSAATGFGGGLSSTGTTTVEASTFVGNIANTASAIATRADGFQINAQTRGFGGGIVNTGDNTFLPGSILTIMDSTFSGNIANSGAASSPSFANADGEGGGIFNADGNTLTITTSQLSGNTGNAGRASAADGFAGVTGYGGGISSGGALTASATILYGNTANSGAAPGIIAGGGGIYSADFYPMALTNLAVSNNTANTASGASELDASGGGIWASGGTITDCAVSGNVVNSGSGIGTIHLSGGGIYDGGGLRVDHSQIFSNTLNTAPDSGLGQDSSMAGGGIYVAGRSTLRLDQSLVAGNFALQTPSDIDVQGGPDGGYVDPASANNLIGPGGSGGLVDGVNGNVVL
jgi:hypothetical protein